MASLDLSSKLTGRDKLKDVERLMGVLDEDLEQRKLSPTQRQAALQQLKAYARDPRHADAIFCKAGVKTLGIYGFDEAPPAVSHEALRCLANTLLLEPKLRQVFADLGYVDKAAERLKSQEADDEFLVSRLLFLMTYDTKVDFNTLFDHGELGKSITTHINRHATHHTHHRVKGMETAALCETLKLLFNLSTFYPDRASVFAPTIRDILEIIQNVPIPTLPLQAPINYLVNALVNLDFQLFNDSDSSAKFIFRPSSPRSHVDKLIDILKQAVNATYKPEELETLAVPLLTVMRKLYAVAAQETRSSMQNSLLPEDTDRDLPLGKSHDLPSKLLQLSTTPVAPNLREAISSFMFELSGKNVKTFIRNIGYGYAAGYLMSHDIPIPPLLEEANHAADGGFDASINPVTGQRLDKEPVDTGPEMSAEEKEREAERLFVLFERLKAIGVVDVKNPVQEAVENGMFESCVEEIEDPD